jgi:hypothetical protein
VCTKGERNSDSTIPTAPDICHKGIPYAATEVKTPYTGQRAEVETIRAASIDENVMPLISPASSMKAPKQCTDTAGGAIRYKFARAVLNHRSEVPMAAPTRPVTDRSPLFINPPIQSLPAKAPKFALNTSVPDLNILHIAHQPSCPEGSWPPNVPRDGDFLILEPWPMNSEVAWTVDKFVMDGDAAAVVVVGESSSSSRRKSAARV